MELTSGQAEFTSAPAPAPGSVPAPGPAPMAPPARNTRES